MDRPAKRTFLTAEWRDLVFLSYKVNDALLQPYLPPGTELDRFEGSAVASLVAFRFLNAKVCRVQAPFFHSFAELNLRFYVREKRSQIPGVVFIREICPYYPVAWMAEIFYKERFLVMRCEFIRKEDEISYTFGHGASRGEMSIQIQKHPFASIPGAASEFLVRRFHGFSKWSCSHLLHYEVLHSSWTIHPASLLISSLPLRKWYPSELASMLEEEPFLVLYSPGSEVSLCWGSVSNAETGQLTGRLWNVPIRAS